MERSKEREPKVSTYPAAPIRSRLPFLSLAAASCVFQIERGGAARGNPARRETLPLRARPPAFQPQTSRVVRQDGRERILKKPRAARQARTEMNGDDYVVAGGGSGRAPGSATPGLTPFF